MVTTAIHPGPGANFISDSSKSIQSLPDGSAAPMTSYPDISQPAIRTISSDQLAALHRQFVSTPLPSKDMFPWLHGVDGTSAPQNFFFGLAPHHFAGSPLLHMGSPDSSPSLPVVPEHRGLMFVYVNEMDPGRLVGSVNPYEILQPAPPSSPSAVSGATPDAPSDLSTHDNNYHPQVLNQYSTIGQHQQLPQQSQTPQDQEGESHKHSQQEEQGGDWIDVENSSNNSASFASSASNDLDASSNMNNSNTSNSGSPQVEDTVPDNPHAGLLLNSFMHSLSDGVNIRNFKIQVPRYALLSDIVVYSKDGFVPSSTPNATATNYVLLEIARQISTAQEAVWKTMKERCPQMDAECRRQTFVLAEPFAALEEKYPELVAVSSSGMASKHKVDFWEQEREQMSLLTRASEIAPGIWLGNTSDLPQTTTSGLNYPATPVSPGTSYASYFYSSIPNTLSQDPASKTAMPSTPPPEEDENPNGYYPPLTPASYSDHSLFQPSICIECRSNPNFPTTITLDRIQNNVNSTPAPLSPKEIFHLECTGSLAANVSPDLFPPSMSSLSSFARPTQPDIPANHAMRRSTALSIVRGGHQLPSFTSTLVTTAVQASITSLINMAFFIVNTVRKVPPPPQPETQLLPGGEPRRHQVLIHCIDGYTETAILALCVVMVHYQLSLAEAYVKLQTELQRSFFIYPNDAILLLEVENQVWQRILIEKSEQESSARHLSARKRMAIASTSTPATAITGSITSASASISSATSSLASSVSSTSSSFFSSLLNMTQSSILQTQQDQDLEHEQKSVHTMEGIEPMPDRDEEVAQQRPFAQLAHEEKFSWFYHPEFEGSFPSRIMPFLYLGNLAHASNPGLLKSLGIQYVLSVGEEASGLDGEDASPTAGPLGDHPQDIQMDGIGENETPARPKQRFMVKLVDDMFDNGVDSLWRHLENCVAFVDEARKANSRVLIHCRVGVSRSATIVIAYMMAHYKLSLVDAYLMVRARRLSVIIQPNLLFMYELLQWEQRLKGRFDSMGWPGIAREVHSLNMYYIGN